MTCLIFAAAVAYFVVVIRMPKILDRLKRRLDALGITTKEKEKDDG